MIFCTFARNTKLYVVRSSILSRHLFGGQHENKQIKMSNGYFMMPSQKDDPALARYCTRLAFETNLRNKIKISTYLLVQIMILTRTTLATNATVHIILRESLENNGCCVSWVGSFYMTSEVLHTDGDRSLYLEYAYNCCIVPT